MNEQQAHTPGPWKRGRYGEVLDANGKDVLFRSMSMHASGSDERMTQAEANTTLAAAAPDLLEALQGMLNMHEEGASLHGLVEDMLQTAHAAIAKATGAA